jgi:hypothetical protein
MVAAVVALAIAVPAIWVDVDARIRAGDEASALSAATGHLTMLRDQVATTQLAIRRSTSTRDALVASITSTLSKLAGTNSSLSTANVHSDVQGDSISTLQTCLGGVQDALNQIRKNHNDRAQQDISAVSGSCMLLAGGANAGLVYPFDFPDPDVILVGDTYYAYATNSVAGNIQVISSTDLVNWTPLGNALPHLPSWAAPDATWAPAVAMLGGHFELYYAVDVAGTNTECISVATSTNPVGPYIDSSTGPLECQESLGGSIDPSVFMGGPRAPYLVWKSGGEGSSAIWSQQLDPAGSSFAAGTSPALLLTPTQPWEAGTIEAPDLVANGGREYLFFSGNNWNTANYAVGVASCSGPLGPCTDSDKSPILSSGGAIDGPGGESVFTDASGNSYIAFHAWVPGAVGFPNSRDLYIRHLSFSGPVPGVGGPVG